MALVAGATKRLRVGKKGDELISKLVDVETANEEKRHLDELYEWCKDPEILKACRAVAKRKRGH